MHRGTAIRVWMHTYVRLKAQRIFSVGNSTYTKDWLIFILPLFKDSILLHMYEMWSLK
jgi:hypothetical protein